MIIKLPDAFQDNPFISNTHDTVFTMMINEIDPNKFINYKKRYYIHGLIKYPKWAPDIDLFQHLNSSYLEMLKKDICYFIFDASTEGFSPIFIEPYFDILYFNCFKYNINVDNIIFVSANLKDETNIINYAKSKNQKPIKVFCFPSFEHVVGNYQSKTALDLLNEEKKYSFELYDNKYFSSLSRVNRYYRTAGTFLLCKDEISQSALISHDRFSKINDLASWKSTNHLTEFSDEDVLNWIESLPLTVDRDDFDVNWALDTPFSDIHRKTIFQIVNETLVDDFHETSLFYSEKTFRPILHFQPFVIWGQKGSNHYLKELGYRLYDDWFDLSFDFIQDPIHRYKELLKTVKTTCETFKNISPEDQLRWKFKNEEVLLHNYDTMAKRCHSKNKLKDFLQKL